MKKILISYRKKRRSASDAMELLFYGKTNKTAHRDNPCTLFFYAETTSASYTVPLCSSVHVPSNTSDTLLWQNSHPSRKSTASVHVRFESPSEY